MPPRRHDMRRCSTGEVVTQGVLSTRAASQHSLLQCGCFLTSTMQLSLYLASLQKQMCDLKLDNVKILFQLNRCNNKQITVSKVKNTLQQQIKCSFYVKHLTSVKYHSLLLVIKPSVFHKSLIKCYNSNYSFCVFLQVNQTGLQFLDMAGSLVHLAAR